ncbi:MAG: hypothetical protein E7575_02625 [Ruminococcaceae bacterium]|nr:hypothetical protein [Oscillospiraceae bacterium]
MKKILSMLIVMALLITGFAFPVSAQESQTKMTITSDMISVSGGTFEYDGYLNAYKITPAAAGEKVAVSLADNYPILAVWVPATAADKELEIVIENDNYLSTVDLSAGHKFIGIDSGFSVGGFSLAFTPSDIYSIYLYADTYNIDPSEVEAVANGSLNDYTEQELTLDSYEVDRYTKYYWDNDIVYNESFYVITDKNGVVQPNEMMYEIDRVVAVQDSYLEKEYVYGEDYLIEDGKLVIPETTSIHVYDHSQVFSDATTNSGWWKTLDGSYVLGGQYNMYFTGYLNITYTVKDTWGGPVPESKGMYLDNIISKLNTPGSTVKLLGIGDSIAGGANVSADLNVEPYADRWSDMVAKEVQNRYSDVNVEYSTIAQGGATATLAIERMNEILAYDPDLLMIEFGTNECMAGDSASVYIDTLKQAIVAVNANIPDCDIILVAPILSNPLIFPDDWFFAYADALYELEREGVAIADTTSICQYVLTNKDYLDMTGDFLCHPNDFSSRIFVQTILKTLELGTESEYIAGLADRITKYRYENDFYEAEWETFQSLAASAKNEISACTSAKEALETYREKAAELDAVPNIEDVDASAALDCSNIIYNNSKAYETVTEVSSLSAQYLSDEKALAFTISYARNCYAMIDYTVGDSVVSADDYDYVVITAYIPETNGTRSKASRILYNTSAGATSQITVDLTRDGAYHSYIVDLSGEANWKGTVSSLQYFAFASSNVGDKLYISSICLAGDLAEAKDIAIERERAANNNAAEAYTILMSDSRMCEMLSADGEEEYILGDVNGDGALSAKDALLLRRCLAGYEDVLANASALDMDASGAVDGADSIIMRKTLAGVVEEVIIGGKNIEVSYDEDQESAKLVYKKAATSLSIDLSSANLSADMFKYITVCAKSADGRAVDVALTLVAGGQEYTGSAATQALASFTADSAKFVDASGEITSIVITFDAQYGEIIYLDSIVLTPTLSSAENAEIVRVGAANLI